MFHFLVKRCLKELVTRVRGKSNDSIEMMMMIMMTKDVQVRVVDVDMAEVQLRVESDAEKKT